MRVWVYPEKKWEDFGAERWTCEWHSLPKNWKPVPGEEDDSPDPNIMVCNVTSHKTEAAAKSAAKRHLRAGDDFYGCPIVRKQIVDWYVKEDKIAEWNDVGEPIYVD